MTAFDAPADLAMPPSNRNRPAGKRQVPRPEFAATLKGLVDVFQAQRGHFSAIM
jgi:hypothetical protein